MYGKKDIRWHQRFQNYEKALKQLDKFFVEDELNELELQGLIKSFEYTYELAWKVMKDFFASKGTKDVFGSKDAIRLAFKNELISYGEIWMNMVEDRYNTVHVYDEEEIKKITDNIRKKYFSAFKEFYTKMNVIKEKELLEKELQAE